MAVLEAPSLERNVELRGARYLKRGSFLFVPSAPAAILCSTRRLMASLFRLILHGLYTCFHQLLHERRWCRFSHWEANNGFRCGITCKFLPIFLYYGRGYMQAYVWFLEAEPRKHPVIIFNSWIGIPGHSEIIGAFRGPRRSRPYGRSDLRQIALRLFRTSCYVFIRSTTFAFCHGCVLPLSQRFFHCSRRLCFHQQLSPLPV